MDKILSVVLIATTSGFAGGVIAWFVVLGLLILVSDK